MKYFALPLSLVVLCIFWTACETIEDVPEEAAADLKKGLRGEGQIVEIDQPDDPFISR